MKKLLSLVCTFFIFQLSSISFSQQDYSQVQLVPHQLTDTLYYLEGAGGNIGVSVGEDGVFIIDDQFAGLSEKIIAAIAELSDKPIQFVFNTHYHGDHTGGNQNLGRTGAVIVAHENVRTKLANDMLADSATELTVDQSLGLPVITYQNAIDFYLNGDKIHAFHVSPAHTDGDSFVHFQNANIIHTGDAFRTTGYPSVDAGANGSFFGIVAAYELLLEISDKDTLFLPGHGQLSTQDEIRKQLRMFYTIKDRISSSIEKGLSLEEIQKTRPTQEYDEDWGDGRIKGPDLTATIYTELMNQ